MVDSFIVDYINYDYNCLWYNSYQIPYNMMVILLILCYGNEQRNKTCDI